MNRTAWAVGAALVFVLAHTQGPLYFSNQNQYLLHGYALAGVGHLDEDWLASTVDPTPAFSLLVAFTKQHLHESFFYVYFALFLGLYCYVSLLLFRYLTKYKATRLAELGFLTLFVVVHSGLFRLASVHALGKDFPWFFQAGVAGQYILGPVFQPSVSGVLLLAALVLFLRDRLWLAVLSLALATVLHATYLLAAGLLVLGFLALCWREGRLREGLRLAPLAALLCAPVALYHLDAFAPTSAEAFLEAQRILVHIRIPHHAVVERWCDWVAGVQIAWIGLALVLVWRSRLFLFLAVPLIVSTLLTLVQVLTKNDTLALLFPWRISAVLVPVATTVILTRLVQLFDSWLARRGVGQVRLVQATRVAILAACTLGGVAINVYGLAYQMSEEELPLLNYVHTHRQRGDVYLLPVHVPKSAGGPRGVPSTSFTPAPRPTKDGHLIAVDFQRFRLHTGAAIFVDFKSIPYKDVDVLEWWRRMRAVQSWYEGERWDETLRGELAQEGITHVVTPANRPLQAAWLEPVYADDYYQLFAIRPPSR